MFDREAYKLEITQARQEEMRQAIEADQQTRQPRRRRGSFFGRLFSGRLFGRRQEPQESPESRPALDQY